MIKKITIGTAIATAVFFILTLCTLPFAVKKQVDGFSHVLTFAEDIDETEIEPTASEYDFVFKNSSDVKVFKSYDDKIHIDFTGAVIGEPVVTVNEKGEKSVVVIDRKFYKSSMEKFFFIHSDQECSIYVPNGITVDLSGDYYVMQSDDEVYFKDNINGQETASIESESYIFYKETVGISKEDLPEAAIKKLVYAGSLVSKDYAQGDISKPTYIDFTVMLKNDIVQQFENFLEENENQYFSDLDVPQASHSATAYVQSQLDNICLTEKMKLGVEEMSFSSTNLNNSITNLSISSDGKLVLANEVEKDNIERTEEESPIRESEKSVLMARTRFIEILINAGIDESESIYIVNIFKI